MNYKSNSSKHCAVYQPMLVIYSVKKNICNINDVKKKPTKIDQKPV